MCLIGNVYGESDDERELCFSAPGRTEISGNHADHQHGCVLAAACVSGSTQEQSITRLETVDSDNMSAG